MSPGLKGDKLSIKDHFHRSPNKLDQDLQKSCQFPLPPPLRREFLKPSRSVVIHKSDTIGHKTNFEQNMGIKSVKQRPKFDYQPTLWKKPSCVDDTQPSLFCFVSPATIATFSLLSLSLGGAGHDRLSHGQRERALLDLDNLWLDRIFELKLFCGHSKIYGE